MFVTLFLKECKILTKSAIYYIFLICMILFFTTQMGELRIMKEPKPGELDYGTKISSDKSVIMQKALENLVWEYQRNNYTTYPIGFYKQVILNDNKRNHVKNILEKVFGVSINEIEQAMTNNYNMNVIENDKNDEYSINKNETFSLQLSNQITYKQFIIYMKKVDDILGGGSSYTEDNVKQMAKVMMTYEEARAVYDDIINKDHVSNAYARLYCDYMGIILAILPMFLAVGRVLKDKRSDALGVIYSKRISSFNVVATRYFANVVMIIVPTMLLSIVPLTECMYMARYLGASGDSLAFIKYIIGWLLPTVMFSLAIGFFITELTNGPIAILLYTAYWFTSLLSTSNLIGFVGWNLMPRFNTIGKTYIYEEIYSQLLKNRIMYTVLSFMLLILTALVFSIKRKGGLMRYGKVSVNMECESEV